MIKPFVLLLNSDASSTEEAVVNYPLVMFVNKSEGKIESRHCVEVDSILKLADAIRENTE